MGSACLFPNDDSEKLLTSTIAIVFVGASDAMPLPSTGVLLDSRPLSSLRLLSTDIRFEIACGVLVLDIPQSNRLFSLSQFSGATFWIDSLSVIVTILRSSITSLTGVDLALSGEKRLPLAEVLEPILDSATVQLHAQIVESRGHQPLLHLTDSSRFLCF